MVHGYSDQVIEQDEAFYVAFLDRFDVDTSGHTADEKFTILSNRWWSHDDLRHTDEWIWPHELVELWSLAGEPEPLAGAPRGAGGVHGPRRPVRLPRFVPAASGRGRTVERSGPFIVARW